MLSNLFLKLKNFSKILVLLDREIVTLFFNLYLSLTVDLIPTVLQVILQLASIRRMIFDTSERQRFVNMLIGGLEIVFANGEKLNEPVFFFKFITILI